MKRSDIRIRDPFIYADKETGWYYMYGTTSLQIGSIAAKNTFSVYKTQDLENFDEGKVVFNGNDWEFWGTKDFWAAELHKFNGKYYLFASAKADGKCRATHIFVCDEPDGDFKPVTPYPMTPANWECLDGTLYVEDGQPYMVFCHEWSQTKVGEIWALPLSNDFSSPKGEPFMLFKASDNPYVTELQEGTGNYVTDGPFLWKEDGKVKMIWSSFIRGRYVIIEAQSDSIKGKWKHFDSRFDFDGGHAMIFTTFEGQRMISLHSPNTANDERAIFIPID